MGLLHLCYVVALVILAASFADAACDDCGVNTVCQNGTCVCKENYNGNPNFYCYSNDVLYCGIMNDPVLQTFGGERVKLLTIGSSRFAEFETRKLGDDGPREACALDISYFTGRYRGKIYISGVQARVLRRYGHDNETAEVSLRIFGDVVNGVYVWTVEVIEYGQTTFVTVATITSDQPLGLARVNIDLGRGCHIRVYRDNRWFLRVEFTCCGVDFGIRPYYPAFRARFPGIWLVIWRHIYLPVWPLWQWPFVPLCLCPARIRVVDVVRVIGIPNRQWALSYLAFTNGGVVYFPGAIPALHQIGPALRACTIPQRLKLFVWDRFIIIVVRFIRCVSPPGSGPYSPLPYFLDATRYICAGEIDRCLFLKSIISGQCSALLEGPNADANVRAFYNQACGA